MGFTSRLLPRSFLRPFLRRRVVFVGHNATASTELRGQQLAAIAKLAPRLSDFEIDFAPHFDFTSTILFLTKGAARSLKVKEIQRLRRKGNIVLADYLDRMPKPDIVENLDGLIASSIRQLIYLKKAYPHVKTHLVTHHADLRIPEVFPPLDALRVGYFGELFNARHCDELGDVVKFVRTETLNPDPSGSWINSLKDCNAHYLVRNIQPSDAHKPFTKGFIAARCGAPVIVEELEGDAAFYLPEDYPYFVTDPTPNGIRDLIGRMRSDFGGPRWYSAVEAMHEIKKKSSPEFIAHELEEAFLYYF